MLNQKMYNLWGKVQFGNPACDSGVKKILAICLKSIHNFLGSVFDRQFAKGLRSLSCRSQEGGHLNKK